MKIKKIVAVVSMLTVFSGLILAMPAFAQTNSDGGSSGSQNGGWQGQGRGGRMGTMRPGVFGSGVFGTVTAVNGNTITITIQQGFGSTSPQTTFRVDATGATVMKNNATSTISNVVVGDKIFAQGTVNGTNVTATMIRDGVMGVGMRGKGLGGMNGNGENNSGKGGWSGATTSPIIGNGQPVVAGTVSAINGNNITVTTKSNVIYSVDASSTKFVVGQNTAALISNVSVGDTVLVQGTVNGTSVAASTVIDQSGKTNDNGNTGTSNPGKHLGFFGGIGAFFMHLFGF